MHTYYYRNDKNEYCRGIIGIESNDTQELADWVWQNTEATSFSIHKEDPLFKWPSTNFKEAKC